MSGFGEAKPGIIVEADTFLWDLDGTLLDSFGIYRDCLNDALRSWGLPEASEALLRQHHHGYIENSIPEVVAALGQRLSEADMRKLIGDFFARDNAAIEDVDHHWFLDAVYLAQQAHDLDKRQIVVTNRPHFSQGMERGNGSPRTMIARSRLLRSIIRQEDVICGDHTEYKKPDGRMITAHHPLAELGSVVSIGDQVVDVQLAHNLGAAAILVDRAGGIRHAEQLEGLSNFAVVADLSVVTVR